MQNSRFPSSALARLATPPADASAYQAAPRASPERGIPVTATDPDPVVAIAARNAANEGITRATVFLRGANGRVEANAGMVTEAFAMDRFGLYVGVGAVTPDSWRGTKTSSP
jgi:hypothetical protein